MSSIALAVFNATIGLLVDKGRDKAAEKLKDGDVTDQKFRGLIVREISDIKSRLNGLSKKDLLASISFFEEGIGFLYKVFEEARITSEHGVATTHAACDEAFQSLAKRIKRLELTDLDEAAKRALSNAKERFKDARRKATEAFSNEALETSDRLLAMQYRVMATILETVDHPEDAIEPCRVCLKDLNSLPAVQNSFNVQLMKGIKALKGLVGKDERWKIISSVCHVNRVIYDVTQTVGDDVHLWIWPAIDIGKDKVDPVRDRRVAKVLSERGMGHCSVTPWSFGQEGEEEHKLKDPRGIATNSSGQFIVGDINEVKMFDANGQFIEHFSLPNDDAETLLHIWDVATDNKDNIYVLVLCSRKGTFPFFVGYVFSNTADLHHKIPVRDVHTPERLTVANGKVLVVNIFSSGAVYDIDGLHFRLFGKGTLERARDIAAANDGRFMVVDWFDHCVHIFSEDGDSLDKFQFQGRYDSDLRIAFHMLSEHVVIAGTKDKELVVKIFTKDGEFVRSTQIHEEGIQRNAGMTVTRNGRIAVLLQDINKRWKVLVTRAFQRKRPS